MSAPPLPIADCPILVWMLSLNREYTKEEYDACHKVVSTCVDHTKVPYNPRDSDSFRQLITLMLPLLMMRHRRIPRSKWKDCITPNGKHWIEQAQDDMTPERFMQSMIGYHLTFEGSLCAMAMCQGTQRRVINIGMGSKKAAVEPRGVTVAAYVESVSHKLTPLELTTITQEPNDETMLRRLSIILALKQAYIKAIGQPIGFDFSRLEFNIPERQAIGDGHPLQGWEFRIWRVTLGVARKDILVSEIYECACAFFRGSMDSKFVFYETAQQLNTWVQFINIDQMLKVIPKLTA